MSSMVRSGCVPGHTQLWSYYAKEVIQAVWGHEPVPTPIVMSQAILQHYGWRSFFVDATAAAAVASWFAGYRLQIENCFEITADSAGTPVALVHEVGNCSAHDGIGHLYVLSREAICKAGIELHDLVGALPARADGIVRPIAQDAWLIGPLRALPSVSIIAHISAPAQAFRDYAESAGLIEMSRVFPSPAEDSILRYLFSVPWELIHGRVRDLPIYMRGLRLPEYSFKPLKCHPADEAFFSPFWIAQNRGGDLLQNALFLRAPRGRLFGDQGKCECMPELIALVRKHGMVVVESDLPISYPEHVGTMEYGKGIVVKAHGDRLIEISSLSLDLSGCCAEGIGVAYGWFYECSGHGKLSRVQHAEECPCPNQLRHENHLAIAGAAERWLSASCFYPNVGLSWAFVEPDQ